MRRTNWIPEDTEEKKRVRERREWLKSFTFPDLPAPRYEEFYGKTDGVPRPTLHIYFWTGQKTKILRTFAFGLGKARAILANLETIKEFVEGDGKPKL